MQIHAIISDSSSRVSENYVFCAKTAKRVSAVVGLSSVVLVTSMNKQNPVRPVARRIIVLVLVFR